jgi:hypothetical protein
MPDATMYQCSAGAPAVVGDRSVRLDRPGELHRTFPASGRLLLLQGNEPSLVFQVLDREMSVHVRLLATLRLSQ